MWKDALEHFIHDYKDDDEVEAILLVGSYAVGNNDQYSDIDVYIILNDNVNYRERGNKLVDNYLIEYFINPVYKVIGYLNEDKRGHGGPMANMIINGKVLFDRNNIVPRLKEEARMVANKKNEKDDMKYYAAWCAFDDLKAAKYQKHMQYYICLKYLVEAYLYNNDYNMLPELKIERFFKDEEYRVKYNIDKFPNNEFNELVINCFDYECMDNLNRLYEYVMNDGEFDINNFVLRNEI